eukprot:2863111-Amphidinium_carterae.1
MAAHAWALAAVVCVAPCGIHPGATYGGLPHADVVARLGMQHQGSAQPLAKHELGWAIVDWCAHRQLASQPARAPQGALCSQRRAPPPKRIGVVVGRLAGREPPWLGSSRAQRQWPAECHCTPVPTPGVTS